MFINELSIAFKRYNKSLLAWVQLYESELFFLRTAVKLLSDYD